MFRRYSGLRRSAVKKTIFLTIVLLFLSTSTAMAFRCGTKLISKGNSKMRVLGYCGEPDSVEVQEVRSNTRYSKWGKTKSTQIIEVWTYNRGPYKFMAELYFAGNSLIRVEERERGFTR